eukprot:CAMPEP_0176425108 /NCGR_PEP_ID=MMETSP0127-20121128/11213_1 /TAXON_ID=938130 /ORGANISM="Platyophrya macrostoma, Strain WH" /LENGTH=266 /DNA_ID=CAMNT_0017806247 /DNA_START=94 /DNA_END=894 /DNA_ORIENTATION=-
MKKDRKGINISETIKITKEIFKAEGFRGFFRGGLLSVLKSTCGTALFFTGLENVHILTDEYRDKLNSYQYGLGGVVNFFNACVIKTATTYLLSPLNVIKTRFEIVGVNEYDSIPAAFKSTYQKEGLKGFYKGVFSTLLRDVPYSGIQYSCYRFLLDVYSTYFLDGKDAKSKSTTVFAISGISSIYAVMLTYPFDNIRVRYQCSEFASFDKSAAGLAGFTQLVTKVYAEEGIKGFYAGYIPRLMKKAFTASLTWTLYEKLRQKKTEN